MARTLARALGAVLITSTISRLLVELNRSPGRQFLHSPIMREAPHDIRAEICRRYYLPYRGQIEGLVRDAIAAGRRVLHISSHSFTPALDGIARRTDVGLLYDPDRAGERDLCIAWQAALEARAPRWTVRRNYPYLGRSDGLTSYLRRRFPESLYNGIELEISQKHVLGGRSIAARDRVAVVLALREALASWRAENVSASDAR
jgi:predicted N-formylglutamate amidohydrolase